MENTFDWTNFTKNTIAKVHCGQALSIGCDQIGPLTDRHIRMQRRTLRDHECVEILHNALILITRITKVTIYKCRAVSATQPMQTSYLNR